MSDLTGVNDIVFANNDLFQEAGEDQGSTDKVHIRIQKRNGKKSITTIQGLATDLDLKKLIKAFKKSFNTNGTIVKDVEVGEVIQLQGDHRNNVKDFLIRYKVYSEQQENDIAIHGY